MRFSSSHSVFRDTVLCFLSTPVQEQEQLIFFFMFLLKIKVKIQNMSPTVIVFCQCPFDVVLFCFVSKVMKVDENENLHCCNMNAIKKCYFKIYLNLQFKCFFPCDYEGMRPLLSSICRS